MILIWHTTRMSLKYIKIIIHTNNKNKLSVTFCKIINPQTPLNLNSPESADNCQRKTKPKKYQFNN